MISKNRIQERKPSPDELVYVLCVIACADDDDLNTHYNKKNIKNDAHIHKMALLHFTIYQLLKFQQIAI